MASHSAVVIANGFSVITRRPARRHCRASLAWVLWGVIRTTRWTSDFLNIFVTES